MLYDRKTKGIKVKGEQYGTIMEQSKMKKYNNLTLKTS